MSEGFTQEQQQKIRGSFRRFVRNKNLPEDMETLRKNLIIARVLNGFTPDEAQAKFNDEDSISIEGIESGRKKVPTDWKFLRKSAVVYAVSTDFLMGLSPHSEFDAAVGNQYALMRGMEEILRRDVAERAEALIVFDRKYRPQTQEYQQVCDCAIAVVHAIQVMRDKYGMDDVAGSAPLLAAVDRLITALAPFRAKLKQLKALDEYFSDVKAGKLKPIPYLMERCSQRDSLEEFLL